MSNVTSIANDWINEQGVEIEELRGSFRANASHLSDCFSDTAEWAKSEAFSPSDFEAEIVRIVMDGQTW